MMPNWENWFKPWELCDYIAPEGKMIVKVDPTTVVGSERPQITFEFAKLLVQLARAYHRKTVLLPDAGYSPFFQPLRAYTALDYWLTEADQFTFNQLLDNDELEIGGRGRYLFNPQTIWGMDFDTWVEQFDPENSQVDCLMIAGPLNRASNNLLAGWDYLKPRGGVVAILPYNDLFGNDATGEYMREWCVDGKELTYGIPVKKALDGQSQKLVVLFGEKFA